MGLGSMFLGRTARRFDKSKTERANNNLIILWADEAQRFMTASEDGTSDYNVVDVIREAGATIIAAAQSTTSFVPPLGNDKSKVLTLNLRNRMIFRAADEQGPSQMRDTLMANAAQFYAERPRKDDITLVVAHLQ